MRFNDIILLYIAEMTVGNGVPKQVFLRHLPQNGYGWMKNIKI